MFAYVKKNDFLCVNDFVLFMLEHYKKNSNRIKLFPNEMSYKNLINVLIKTRIVRPLRAMFSWICIGNKYNVLPMMSKSPIRMCSHV